MLYWILFCLRVRLSEQFGSVMRAKYIITPGLAPRHSGSIFKTLSFNVWLLSLADVRQETAYFSKMKKSCLWSVEKKALYYFSPTMSCLYLIYFALSSIYLCYVELPWVASIYCHCLFFFSKKGNPNRMLISSMHIFSTLKFTFSLSEWQSNNCRIKSA